MYTIFEQLLKERGLKISDVSKATGISYSSFTDWKAGRYTPKSDKRQKIADFFGVSLNYLDTGEQDIHYVDKEAEQIAQKVFENHDVRLLFEAAQGSDPKNLRLAAEMLKRFKSTNNDG